jgi:hypothetical protein
MEPSGKPPLPARKQNGLSEGFYSEDNVSPGAPPERPGNVGSPTKKRNWRRRLSAGPGIPRHDGQPYGPSLSPPPQAPDDTDNNSQFPAMSPGQTHILRRPTRLSPLAPLNTETRAQAEPSFSTSGRELSPSPSGGKPPPPPLASMSATSSDTEAEQSTSTSSKNEPFHVSSRINAARKNSWQMLHNSQQVPPAFRDHLSRSSWLSVGAITAASHERSKRRWSLQGSSHEGIIRDILSKSFSHDEKETQQQSIVGGRNRMEPFDANTTSAGLPVNFITLNEEKQDSSDVKTYHTILEAIVMSTNTEKAQRVLNVLATMTRNGVGPNETTWALIEKCSDETQDVMQNELANLKESGNLNKLSFYSEDESPGDKNANDEAATLPENERKSRKKWKVEQDLSEIPPAFRISILAMLRKKRGFKESTEVKNLDKQSRSNLPTTTNDEPAPATEQSESSAEYSPGDSTSPPKQRKESLPPKVVAARGNERTISKSSSAPKQSKQSVPLKAKPRVAGDVECAKGESSSLPTESKESLAPKVKPQIVAGGTEKASKKLTDPPGPFKQEDNLIPVDPKQKSEELYATYGKVHCESRPRAYIPSPTSHRKQWKPNGKPEEPTTPQTAVEKVKEPRIDAPSPTSEFAKHGEIKFRRPGSSPKNTGWKEKLPELPRPAEIRPEDVSDLRSCNKLLAAIAESGLPDKAKQAGNVLKFLKEKKIVADDATRTLLEKCLEELASSEDENMLGSGVKASRFDGGEAPDTNGMTTPTNVKKTVRFAEHTTTRFIRRRRSISAMERVDDPLTPPRRVSEQVDLAPGRFSSGLQDDRPAAPRRADSMSSLMSDRSGSSDCSGNSADLSSSSILSLVDSPVGRPTPIIPDVLKLPFGDSPKTQPRKIAVEAPLVARDGGWTPKMPTRRKGLKTSPPNVDVRQQTMRRVVGGVEDPTNLDVPLKPTRREEGVEKPENIDAPIRPSRRCSIDTDLLKPTSEGPTYDRQRSTRRPILIRRSSISGIERSDAPLTPIRRISSPVMLICMAPLSAGSAPRARRLKARPTTSVVGSRETAQKKRAAIPKQFDKPLPHESSVLPKLEDTKPASEKSKKNRLQQKDPLTMSRPPLTVKPGTDPRTPADKKERQQIESTATSKPSIPPPPPGSPRSDLHDNDKPRQGSALARHFFKIRRNWEIVQLPFLVKRKPISKACSEFSRHSSHAEFQRKAAVRTNAGELSRQSSHVQTELSPQGKAG